MTTEPIACASCGSLNVKTTRIKHSFDYGCGKNVVSIECKVPLRSCRACKFEFLDDEAERIKDKALCRHLGVMTTKEKIVWANGLDIGDIVNDCKGKDMRIVEIGGEGYDCQIVFEDGSCCSAMNCCSPAKEV